MSTHPIFTTNNYIKPIFFFLKMHYSLKIDWRMRVTSQRSSHLLSRYYCFILRKLSYTINILYLDYNSHPANFSSTKHHIHDSPGSYDLITGCKVSLKCFVPCLFLEASQHPTWPHVRHSLKCTHSEPIFSHSSQPLVFPDLFKSAWSICSHWPCWWLLDILSNLGGLY